MGGKKEIYRDVRFFHEALQFSLHFNGHFPGGPQLAGTRMSLF